MDNLFEEFTLFMASNADKPAWMAISIERLKAKVRFCTPILRYGDESYRQMPAVIIANLCKSSPNGMYSKHGLDMIHRILSKDPSHVDTLPQWMLCVILSKMDLDIDESASLFFRFEKMCGRVEMTPRLQIWKRYAEKTVLHKDINSIINALILEVFGRKVQDSRCETRDQIESIRFISSTVHEMRGFAGMDCIFINEQAFTAKFAKENESPCLDGAMIIDIITVTIHEYAHIRVRKVFNDYNFSTPKYAVNSQHGEQIEFSRMVEKKFFKVIVDWVKTRKDSPDIEAFIQNFIEAIESNTDLPKLPDNTKYAERPEGVVMNGADCTIRRLEIG